MKFSIVIPVYNVAPWLRECLDSVLAQTCGDWEAICVDDGSPDGAGAILDEYAARDARFVVIHQQNSGEGGARNAALEVARGEWICFLDGDDAFAPAMLSAGEKLTAENPDCDLVRVSAATFQDGEASRKLTPFRGGLLTGVFCVGFYRRAKSGDVRFADFFVGADRVYAASCVFQTGRIAESEIIGYLYRQRATSVSHVRMSPRKARDSFLHVAEILKIAAANKRTLESAFHRQLVAQVLEAGAANIRQLACGDQCEVRRCWRACVAELKAAGLLTPWGNFVAAALRLLPFDAVIFVLCELPYRLKKAGIHRYR